MSVPLRNHSSADGRTETVFGEINTSYIIESTKGTDEVFYTFPIIPNGGSDGFETYNLVVKTENEETASEKVVVYEPAEAWVLNGENDYLKFSGDVSTYTLDGQLEATVAYIAGTGNCPPPPPCPDCPTNPQGPGGGGPGGPPGPPTNPGEGDPETPDPPTFPGDTPPPPPYPGQPGTSSGGLPCYYVCVYDENDECSKMECIEVRPPTFTANRIPERNCGEEDDSGGVIITTQQDPCTKTKGQLGTASVKGVIQDLKDHIASGTGGEKGYGINKNGVGVPTTQNSNHGVNFGDPSLLTGAYHNHTGTKVDIFSPKDISTLLEIARGQTISNGVSNASNAFMGLVAPNGVHYVIRFNGSHADLPPNGFSSFDLDRWTMEQTVQMYKLLELNEFKQTVNGKDVLNSKGLEQILFDTLRKMGLKDKVTVQKMDDSNNVSTVNKNSDGTTTAVPCA